MCVWVNLYINSVSVVIVNREHDSGLSRAVGLWTRLPTGHHEPLNYRAGLVQFGSRLTGS